LPRAIRARQVVSAEARYTFPALQVSTGFLMASNQHRNHALLYVERLRALIEHANLPDVEVKRLATEINELLERHIALEVRPRREAA
jgi:hypothetical protein